MARVRRSVRRATGRTAAELDHESGNGIGRALGADPGADLGDGRARVAEAVRALAGAALGRLPDLAEPPEPVYAGWGPEAYRVRVATDDPRWARPLVARAASPAVLAREAAWVDRVRSAKFPAPEIVAAGRAGVLVFRDPAGANLAERMITDMAALPRLLADFGRLHAALHALPASTAPEGHAAPPGLAQSGLAPPDIAPPTGSVGDGRKAVATGRARDGGARDGGARDAGVAGQRAWLAAHAPPAGEPVVCHGDLNPAHVSVDGDSSVAVNWTGAGLADAEYDVAATLVGFWSAALYVDSAVQRRVLKMVRESLAGAYLAAYREAAARALDDARLRYWQAFHLCRVAAGIVRHRDHGATGPWDTAAHVAQPTAALDDLAREFWRLTGD